MYTIHEGEQKKSNYLPELRRSPLFLYPMKIQRFVHVYPKYRFHGGRQRRTIDIVKINSIHESSTF